MRLRSLLWAVSLVATACAPAEEHEPEEETEAAEEEEEAEATPPQRPVIDLASLPDLSGFPHGPHLDILCETCHQTVARHVTHADSPCTSCHSVPATVAAFRVPTERECMACHHVETRGLTCAQCHLASELAGRMAITARLTSSIWPRPFDRQLPFDHNRHANETCADCHTMSAYENVETECSTCHDSHHTATASCSQCHEEGGPPSHGDAVHAGCTGTGCHADVAVTGLPPSKTLCLVCHQDQVDHEPEGDCAVCHGIRVWNGRPVGRSRDGGPL